MIRFFCKDGGDCSWHVGQPKPTFLQTRSISFKCGTETTREWLPLRDVCRVEANGSELLVIRQQFRNLPDIVGDSVIWEGDIAQFIYTNLKV